MRRVLLLILPLLLSACFKDASEDRRDPTTVNSQTLNAIQQPQVTPSTNATTISTLTPTPQIDPTNTFPVGGPPIEDDSPTEEVDEAVEPTARPSNQAPTRIIPSFTPANSGSTFGDPGITATAIATQPIPDALITPTAFPSEIPECIYSVQANDTLFSIATQYSVTPDDFIAINPDLAVNPNALFIGQLLAIPNCIPEGQGGGIAETEAITTPTIAATAANGTATHTVADGETLFRIAIQYNTSVEAILAANPELGGSTIIYPGQVLVIPEQP